MNEERLAPKGWTLLEGLKDMLGSPCSFRGDGDGYFIPQMNGKSIALCPTSVSSEHHLEIHRTAHTVGKYRKGKHQVAVKTW
jgi:hypothetical protein